MSDGESIHFDAECQSMPSYAKSIPFFTDDLRIYNSDAFEKEVPTKQTSLHAALMAT